MNDLTSMLIESADKLPKQKDTITKKINDNTKLLSERRIELKVDNNLIESSELNKLLRKGAKTLDSTTPK